MGGTSNRGAATASSSNSQQNYGSTYSEGNGHPSSQQSYYGQSAHLPVQQHQSYHHMSNSYQSGAQGPSRSMNPHQTSHNAAPIPTRA